MLLSSLGYFGFEEAGVLALHLQLVLAELGLALEDQATQALLLAPGFIALCFTGQLPGGKYR